MNKFKDFIEIDKKFQNSINLQLDIDNLSKLNSYIPTHSSILVLDGFLNSVLSDRDKANILIGPYGKGKSHLLLVLLALLNDGKGDRTKKTINKIEKVSKETAEKIKTIQSSVKPFLPVIISGTEKDLNKEFIIALMESLRKNNLMNVAPESDYGKALEVIAKWQKDFKQVYESFKQIVREYGRTVEEFMGELKEMKEEALNIFKEIESDLGIPMPKSGDLTRWADQGVLLLNATLTVRAHQAGSHQNKGWEQFTDAVIHRLAEEREHLVFILWGSYAQRKGDFIDRSKHLVLKSPHPSPLSAHRGFFGNGHFSKANAYLKEHGIEPIQW